jgi:hypothetical protein
MSSTQERLKDKEIAWETNANEYNIDIRTNWLSSTVQAKNCAIESQHISEWLYILIPGMELNFFEVERIPFKIMDKWAMKLA